MDGLLVYVCIQQLVWLKRVLNLIHSLFISRIIFLLLVEDISLLCFKKVAIKILASRIDIFDKIIIKSRYFWPF